MSMKKKLGLTAATAILGLGLIGGGTFAYFSDTEVSNNSFAAGTLDLELKSTDDSAYVDLSVDNMKPGDWTIKQLRLYSEGSLKIKDVKMNVDYTVSDTNGDNAGEDFADHILVRISENRQNGPVVLDWTPLSEIEDLVVAEDLNSKTGPLNNSDRQVLIFNYKFDDNGADQNKFQDDKLDFQLIFDASQQDGELR
ncbi:MULTISPECIES: TasA family protein [unclassified Fredinandcohnia]|uniref:TasA family protein n=1 Tax=unclassified Fredinandcohnia TaxID=2837514 RepID=UPI0030FD5417